MRHTYRALILLPLAVALVFAVLAQSQTKSSSDVERGKYLVEEVAKCSECHTPRDQNNELDPQRWLEGATIWIRPAFQTTNWADLAPPLAGLPSYTDEQMVNVLEKGERANGGGTVQPPMHIYHMNHPDARAIIAYLRSLPNHH